MTLHAATIAARAATNPAETAGNPVNWVMEDVLRCFVAWLEHNPSDQKNYQILLALGRESLKTAKRAGQHGKFDKKEIAAAAGVAPDVDLQSWFRWPDVERYWEARRDSYIASAAKHGIYGIPALRRKATAGRNMAEHWLEIGPVLAAGAADSPGDVENAGAIVDGTDQPNKTIRYDATQPGDIRCAFWLRPWLAAGSFTLRGWRRWSVIGSLLFFGGAIFMVGVYCYALLVKPALISTATITTLLLMAVFAALIWRFALRPIVCLLDDRIICTDMAVPFSEEPAQLEVMNVNDAKTIQLVRYTATCSICGATVAVRTGEPDFQRRLIGRCAESPREHIFSFDRVTRKGVCLR